MMSAHIFGKIDAITKLEWHLINISPRVSHMTSTEPSEHHFHIYANVLVLNVAFNALMLSNFDWSLSTADRGSITYLQHLHAIVLKTSPFQLFSNVEFVYSSLVPEWPPHTVRKCWLWWKISLTQSDSWRQSILKGRFGFYAVITHTSFKCLQHWTLTKFLNKS